MFLSLSPSLLFLKINKNIKKLMIEKMEKISLDFVTKPVQGRRERGYHHNYTLRGQDILISIGPK